MSTATSPEPIERSRGARAGRGQRAGAVRSGALFQRLEPHLAELDKFMRAQIAVFEPEIREMADYCIDTSGKRIRPALVFLSGWRDVDGVQPELVRVAAVVELVHLATLVHDDVMDGADLRRSRGTAARAYGPVAAVLLGDALFSHALHIAAQFPTNEVCLSISESTRRVCAGEIIQTLRRRRSDLSLADYRRIIDLKTAELFHVSCQLGSRLGGYPDGFVAAASRFGRRLGIAYQIYDDLADYFGEEKRIGKTLGTDLASGKITLPILELLGKLAPAERAALVEEIEGVRAPQLATHLRQMADHGVFPVVADAVFAEINAAVEELAPWHHLPPAQPLLALCEVLKGQVQSLESPAATTV